MKKKEDNVKDKKTFLKKKKKIKEKKNENDDNIREVVVERDNGFNTMEVIVIILISILFGVVIGYILSSSRTFGTKVSDGVTEIITTYETIIDNYYDELDEEKLVDAAVSGMIGVLDDPYSIYMNSEDTESFMESVNGSFVGIGVTVEWSEDIVKIIEVMDNSPALDAGLKVGDILTKVNNKSVKNKSLDEISNLIKGKSGSKVDITVLRDEEEYTITAKRRVVEIPSVESKQFNNIGYLYISGFASNTNDQFTKQLEELEENNIDSLIIDVRDNPGGKLGQVNKILDIFLDKKTVLYQIVSKDKKTKVYASDSKKKNMPIVILVNESSASASEILAVSLQENYKNVKIVGKTTYGKGTIQKAIELSSGASIKYTTQKWLTPKGKWINEKGVVPDIDVEQGFEYRHNPIDDNDLQLQKALELLTK